MAQYGDSFYLALDSTSEPSARTILPLLLRHVPVGSAVDIGCGDGSWLAVLRELSGAGILGVDGPWHSGRSLKIPADCFRRMPLDQPFRLARSFDLAICLEVAEHLPPERAAEFIAELTQLAPLVLFSAAIPGQGGVNHFNEQWPDYWAELFESRGYLPVDIFRQAVWDHPEVAWWYKQNVVLYVHRARLDALASLSGLVRPTAGLPGLIHPDAWRQAIRRAEPGFGRWLKMGPSALRRSLGKRNR